MQWWITIRVMCGFLKRRGGGRGGLSISPHPKKIIFELLSVITTDLPTIQGGKN